MKIKPLLFDSIQTTHTSFRVDFKIDNNITFIKGDSGTGKSAVFSFIKELAAEQKGIKCYNYLDLKTGYKQSIKISKKKLFVIDNADLLLDDGMREYIAHDKNNQYIIIGRNPKGLLLNYDEICELKSTKQGEITVFSLERMSLQHGN